MDQFRGRPLEIEHFQLTIRLCRIMRKAELLDLIEHARYSRIEVQTHNTPARKRNPADDREAVVRGF